MATEPKLYGVYLARVGFLESSGFKIRPILVVSKPRGAFQTIMTVPISAQTSKTDVDVLIDDISGTGLLKQSVARVHRLAATAGSQLLEEIGVIDDKSQKTIKKAFKKLLNL